MLSMHAEEGYVFEAIRNGATGYVIKNAGSGELTKAIRDAAEGRRYFSPPISRETLDLYDAGIEEQGLDPYETLTPRWPRDTVSRGQREYERRDRLTALHK